MKVLWGLDLGGTKIEGVVLKFNDGQGLNEPEVLIRKRVPTESAGGYEKVLGQIKKLLDEMEAESGIKPERIGLGTPGVIDPKSGLLKNSNTVCLNGMPLEKDLAKFLGISVTTANDANCFALAESQLGIVKKEVPDAKVVFGIIMGTGVGSGIVINGTALYGNHGIAGEWGHNYLDESGGKCYCGKIGCVETMISGPALERFYEKKSGEKIALPEIVEQYKLGQDQASKETIEHLLFYFGKAVANVVNILDPDVIVLGGGLGNIDLLYSEGPKHILPHLFNKEFNTPLLKPMLGDSAGVFGAAFL